MLNNLSPKVGFGQSSGLSFSQYVPKKNVDIPVSVKNYSETEIVQFLMNRLWAASNSEAYRKMCDLFPKYWRAYNGVFKGTNLPQWRSQLYIRLAFRTVETLRAYFQDALFGNQPYVFVDPSDVKRWANAANMQRYMDFELYHTKIEQRMIDVLNYSLKCGTAIVKTWWRYYADYRHDGDFKRNGMNFELSQKKGKKYLKWDDPWFSVLDPRKVIPDPQAEYPQDMRYCFEQYITDLDQLIKDKDRYGYINLESLYDEVQRGYAQFGAKFDFINDVYAVNRWSSELDDNRRRVFIDEYWGRLDMPGNHDDPRIYRILLANNRHIISIRPSFYSHGELPYQFFNLIPQEHSLYGIGAIEPILTDNHIMNAMVNMRLDSMQYIMNPRLIVARGAIANRRSIENSRPGEVIYANSTRDVSHVWSQLGISDTAINSYQQTITNIMQHAESTMAMNPNSSGTMSSSRRSATEASQAMEGANARFTCMVKLFKFTGFDGLIRQYGALIQQYFTGEKMFKILNPLSEEEKSIIMKLSKEDIQGDFLYQIKDNTVTNKDVKQQLITNLLGVLAPYTQLLGPNITKELLRAFLENSPISNQLNIDEVLPRAPILDQESASLEKVSQLPQTQGTPGMMPAGQSMPIPGMAPMMQGVAEQSGIPGGIMQ